mmetsp:Transcript_26766/g.59096  ORF Transcript_26766/g.59096 Transcript_26766/m.59096 type:complete len:287 (+) Transcript_26766:1308-2168(+)
MCSNDASKVPPPISKTRMLRPLSPASLAFSSRPYARAAAVGSLMIRSTSSPAISPALRVACRWASLKYAGTVTTALVTGCPSLASATFFMCVSTIALTCSGVNLRSLPPANTSMTTVPLSPSVILKGNILASSLTAVSDHLWPMMRFTSNSVVVGFLGAANFAAWPTTRCPSSENPTYDGVVELPSLSSIISTPSGLNTETQLYVVPRSIPITTSGAAPLLEGLSLPFLSLSLLLSFGSGFGSFGSTILRVSRIAAFVGSSFLPSLKVLNASSYRSAKNKAVPCRE